MCAYAINIQNVFPVYIGVSSRKCSWYGHNQQFNNSQDKTDIQAALEEFKAKENDSD